MLKRIFGLIVILTICSSYVFSSEINSLRLVRIWTDSNIYSPNEKVRINAEIENIGGSSFFVDNIYAIAEVRDSNDNIILRRIVSQMNSCPYSIEKSEIKVGEKRKFCAYKTYYFENLSMIDLSFPKIGQYTIKVTKLELVARSSQSEFVTLGYITPTKNNEVTISVVPEIEKERLIIEKTKLKKMQEQIKLLEIQVNNSKKQIDILKEQVKSNKKYSMLAIFAAFAPLLYNILKNLKNKIYIKIKKKP